MRSATLARLAVVGLMVGVISGSGCAVVPSTATASVTSGGPVQATIGTFIFEQGSTLGLEIHREEPCPCLCDPWLVTGLSVLDKEGNTVFADEAFTQVAIPCGEWTGRWDLVDEAGNPVGEGSYTIVVSTTLGDFYVQVEVVGPGKAAQFGRVLAQARVCGAGLAVYRLVDEEDNGREITLRVGERLMVALPGNPTTGYKWEIESEPSTAIVKRIEGTNYRPTSTLIGGGGIFYFRYEAFQVDAGNLTLAYRRPWEALPPEKTFAITVKVR